MQSFKFLFRLVIAASCTLSCTHKAATVGDYTITQSMVDYRDQVAKIYYPNEPTKVGLNQLMRSYTDAAIMKRYGRPVLSDALEREEKRIEQNTRDPATLGKIHAVFGKDHSAYVQVFILPTLVDRIFYSEFFLGSPEIQQALKAKADAFFLRSVQEPESLIRAAMEQGLTVQEVVLNPDEGLEWGRAIKKGSTPSVIDQSKKSSIQVTLEETIQKEQRAQEKELAHRWLNEVVGRTRPGAVFQNLVDMKESWVVLKYLGPESKPKPHYRFQAVSFPKADFQNWLKNESAAIPIQIEDSARK